MPIIFIAGPFYWLAYSAAVRDLELGSLVSSVARLQGNCWAVQARKMKTMTGGTQVLPDQMSNVLLPSSSPPLLPLLIRPIWAGS